MTEAAVPGCIGCPMVLRLTSTLNPSRNDTGRTAFCGPVVISAVTGLAVSQVEEEIWRARGRASACKSAQVTGTTEHEVRRTLGRLGFSMDVAADFRHLDKGARPSLWSWMQRPRNAFCHYLLGIHKGRTGHWIAVKGVMTCDTYTGGRWLFVSDGPHKSAKIMDAYIVRRDVGA
ncbi:MAG: hypothetical protein F9K44_04200 [Hyphomicrobiaceae bacterium]|nr:MAG: hypothetical protein F9K44_04200 [Hyphomicrobiaceae bacterium]